MMDPFADFIPLDMHCHGIGKFDFMEPSNIVLERIDDQLKIEGIRSVVTLYIPQHKLVDLEMLLLEFNRGKSSGQYDNIVGVALEGPMLASFGGTPEQGCWTPTKCEWRRLARLGEFGLVYIVMSPDADIGTRSGPEFPQSIEWIVDTLYDFGVRPALGHYKKDDPIGAARMTTRIINHVERKGYSPLFTDHLFNDMPLNFKHCWRTASEKLSRLSDLGDVDPYTWNLDNMSERLGHVPAALIAGARKGLVKICMNFDGEHVDIEICKAAVRLAGSQNIMLMTDRIQSQILAGQRLSFKDSTTLLYQNRDIVAGGTLSVMRQIMKMVDAGIPTEDIKNIVSITASLALGVEPCIHVDKCLKPVAAVNEDELLV